MVWWGNAGAALPAAEIFVPFALLPESLPISKLPKFVHAHSGGSRSVEEVLSSVGSGLLLSHWTSVTSNCFLLGYWVQLSSTDLWAFYNYYSTLSTFEELCFHDVFLVKHTSALLPRYPLSPFIWGFSLKTERPTETPTKIITAELFKDTCAFHGCRSQIREESAFWNLPRAVRGWGVNFLHVKHSLAC